MKYIVSATLILSLFNPNNTPVLNRGGTGTFYSYNYEYFVDYYDTYQEGQASSGVASYTIGKEYPTYYGFKVNILFNQPVKYVKMLIELTAPASGQIAYWQFIGENCYITKSSNTIYYIECRNCTNATFEFLGSYEDVNNAYGYNRLSFSTALESNNNWIDYGNSYCNIVRMSYTGTIQYIDDPNYTTQLNTILSQTDSIETYLLNIWNQSITNGGYLPDINSSLTSVKNTLTTISNALANIDNTLDDITWINTGATYKGWTTDYLEFDTLTYGNHGAGYYVLETPQFGSPYNNGIYKLTLGIGNGSTTIDNIKFYQYWTDQSSFQQFTIDSYMYIPTRNNIIIYFTVNEQYRQWPQSTWPLCIYVNKTLYKYSAQPMKLEYLPSTDIEYWTLLNVIKNITALNENQKSLNEIIDILDDITVTQTDQQNKQTVDNFFNTVKQNLVFPTIPTSPDIVPLRETLKSIKDVIDLPQLDIFKYMLLLELIVIVFMVVVK